MSANKQQELCQAKTKEATKHEANYARTVFYVYKHEPKAKASQEQHKTRATDENRDLQFCAQTQWQKISPNDLAKKK